MKNTEEKERVILNEFHVGNTSSHEERKWSFSSFKKGFQANIMKFNKNDLEVDLIGLNTSVVNAIRRVLLAELPSIAIDKVHIYNNTSIIQDEVLAHRLGLIPLKADPRNFHFRKSEDPATYSEKNTLKYRLNVVCEKTKMTPCERKSRTLDDKRKELMPVYSDQIKWEAIDGQKNSYTAADVGPVFPDILIVKLKPGQEIDAHLFANKDIGKEHAKYQPVATASYRLLPEITILQEITGEKAQRLKDSFSPGVIELVRKENGEVTGVVANARYDTCSRNIYRHNDLKDLVKISRVPDHFIFNIESMGALTPDLLFEQAIDTLISKLNKQLSDLKK